MFAWMDMKFDNVNDRFVAMDTRINERFTAIDTRFSAIEKDIAVIKAVLIMKNIIPQDLTKSTEQ